MFSRYVLCKHSRRMDIAQKVAFLRNGRHFRGRPHSVRVLETHFSWVFLAGPYAYKLKKPLRQAAMDYRTIGRRKRGCLNEVRLNRRLAPDIYLGIVPLARTRDGKLALMRGNQPVDWLLKMRRLPAGRMLDRIIATRAVTDAELERVVRRLSSFFRRARRQPMKDAAYRARLRARTIRTARELRAPDLGLSRHRVQQIARAQLDFIRRGADFLAGRGAHLIEGHGDLRPEHVFVGSASAAACVIDGLEFDPDLRRCDPADELAFLLMECNRIGGSQAVGGFLDRYREISGDAVPQPVIHFYMSQRALTRAMIAVWHLRDPELTARRVLWKRRARSYLGDALRYIRLAVRARAPSAPLNPPVAGANAPAAGRRTVPRASAAEPDRKAGRPKAS